MGRIKYRGQPAPDTSSYNKVQVAVINLSKSINKEFKEIFRLELTPGNLLGITLGTDSTSKDKCFGKIIVDGQLLKPVEIKALRNKGSYYKIKFLTSLSIEASLRSTNNVSLCIMYEGV